jgi:hypothetical protein
MELDVDGNSCIKQKVSLTPGRYLLEYDWAARDGVALDSCKMGIYMNGKSAQSHTPVDYHVNHGRYLFNVAKETVDATEVAFCGEGSSDGYGAVLDIVNIYSLDECQN